MDHKDFDDRIKKKLSGLNPRFNPDSWDDMVDMLRFSTIRPWYVRWQKAIWGSALLLFSLLNFYLLWQIRTEKGLTNDLHTPLQEKVVLIDTIRIIDTLFVTKPASPQYPKSPDAAYHQSGAKRLTYPHTFPFQLSTSLGEGSPLASSGFTGFRLNGITDYSFSDYNAGGDRKERKSVPFITTEMVDPEEWLEEYIHQFKVQKTTLPKRKSHRNYRSNAFEARIGLTAGLLIPNPDIGERYISKSLGVMKELSLKRNLRFLTGVHFNDITYKLDEVDNDHFDAEDLARFPGYAELTTTPDEIIIENELIQVPLHLRLYKNLNYNWSVFISGGPTIDFLLNQSFRYNYIEIENDRLIEFNEFTREKDLRIYLGNFTGSVGIEHNFSKRLAGQMNVNYQYGLSRLGVERRSVNALGLNLAAFYKLN